jgi:cellulose synthase/poly-beta-1,6-N-acetylglucosamine synthase-like glycosyltransferase
MTTFLHIPLWLCFFLLAALVPLIYNLYRWIEDQRHLKNLLAARSILPRLNIQDGKAPRVSFLVAAWNEKEVILRFLDAVLSLGYPNFELVLCAGGQDGTWKIASAYQDERLILLEQQPGEGKQRALQRCLEKASGEIIYLIDADCLIDDSVLTWTLAPIINEGEEAISGSNYTPFPEQMNNWLIISQYASQLFSALYHQRYSSGLLGGNSAIRRQALERAGAFNSKVSTGTDYELAKRLLRHGTRIRYEVNASIPSEFPSDIKTYFRQQARWVRNMVLHGIRFQAYGEVLVALRTTLVGFGMLVIPLLALLCAFQTGIFLTAAVVLFSIWIACIVHALFSRLRYLLIAKAWSGFQFPIQGFLFLPVSFFIDLIAWTIPMGEYAYKPLRNRW